MLYKNINNLPYFKSTEPNKNIWLAVHFYKITTLMTNERNKTKSFIVMWPIFPPIFTFITRSYWNSINFQCGNNILFLPTPRHRLNWEHSQWMMIGVNVMIVSQESYKLSLLYSQLDYCLKHTLSKYKHLCFHTIYAIYSSKPNNLSINYSQRSGKSIYWNMIM